MANLALVHGNLATAVILFNLILGVWATIKYFRRDVVDGNFAGALALSPILGAVQMLLGLLLVANASPSAARLVHYLYGVLVVINIPAAFAFTRGRDDRGMLVIYAAVLFFTSACGARAFISAHAGGV
jgi:uncharacterized transporter YbjL